MYSNNSKQVGKKVALAQKILIFDDQQENLDFMSRYLIKVLECDVQMFLNPAEALTWSKKNAFDLGLFDYRMPEMSGLDLVRQVRRQKKHHGVPLVLITSEDSRSIIPDAFDAGVSDYLPRPFDRSEFIGRVKNLL